MAAQALSPSLHLYQITSESSTMSDGPDKTDELYPIAVLIDELKVHFMAAAGTLDGSQRNSMMTSFYD